MRLITIALLSILFALSADVSSEEIYRFTFDSTTLTLETEQKWKNLRIRVLHNSGGRRTVSEDKFYTFLDSAFVSLAEKADTVEYGSLFLGRVLEYPWISRFLADTSLRDPGWQNDKGKPVKGHANTFVRKVLSNAPVFSSITTRLTIIGYRMSGVSVEKVLISQEKPEHLPSWIDPANKVPYDAMIWLTLVKQ